MTRSRSSSARQIGPPACPRESRLTIHNEEEAGMAVVAQEWLTSGDCAPWVVEHRLLGPVPVGVFQFKQPPGSYPDPPLDAFSLFTNKAPLPDLAWDIGGLRWRGPKNRAASGLGWRARLSRVRRRCLRDWPNSCRRRRHGPRLIQGQFQGRVPAMNIEADGLAVSPDLGPVT